MSDQHKQKKETAAVAAVSEIEHAPDCRPEHMSAPDDEGIRDCGNCGLWEYPPAESRAALRAEAARYHTDTDYRESLPWSERPC